MDKKVSIIITTYNYAEYVGQAIESALEQTYSNVEVIVVDDGSTDGTDEKLKKYTKQITYMRVENGGVVRARNIGFDHCSGEYVCFLDADDQLHPDYLQVLVKSLESSGDRYQFSYCDTQCIGLMDDRIVAESWNIYKLLFKNYIIPCAVMTRNSFVEVGKYSSYMSGKFGFEDWELWIKFVGHGYRGVYVPGPYFLYRVHGLGRNAEGELNRKQQLRRIKSHNSKLYNRLDVAVMVFLQRAFWRSVYGLKQIYWFITRKQ